MIANDSVAPYLELALVDHDESKAVSWNQLRLALVIQSSLLPARDPGYRHSPIEDGNRLGVLLLLELHNEFVRRPVSVDREPG